MKRKIFKRLALIAGIALAAVLPLTVLPGFSYRVDGPWDTGIEKRSLPGDLHSFGILLPNYYLGFVWVTGRYEHWTEPEGFFRNRNGIYIRYRQLELYAEPQDHRKDR